RAAEPKGRDYPSPPADRPAHFRPCSRPTFSGRRGALPAECSGDGAHDAAFGGAALRQLRTDDLEPVNPAPPRRVPGKVQMLDVDACLQDRRMARQLRPPLVKRQVDGEVRPALLPGEIVQRPLLLLERLVAAVQGVELPRQEMAFLDRLDHL